ncbi:DNA topoisomerase IB [Rubrolithibacter danxiaensis]|uniref:DNA topoisomerase IB n=1 Tax=Rubrolithibacter danxiaensis TaxID=3390805 RepID=UPI003BF8DEE0
MEIEELLEETGLVYMTDSNPGISRKRVKDGFVYINSKGQEITDQKLLYRIKKLILPPAWENVWIAPKANAHLQATGIDQAGRKQYRYHNEWSKYRNQNKYYRLLEFGKKLPEFRKNLKKDLQRREYDDRKVLAISVSLMQKTLIRVGNESYKQLYGSYGLSTLRDRHVKIEGAEVKLAFKGKKGVQHEISLTDRSLARLVKKCRDIPGQELFQYYTSSGDRRSIDSGMINSYIKDITSCDFTAKDFRTWSGTLEALRTYAEYEYHESVNKRKKVTVAMLDTVASKLGNTRAVCKKSYVFPPLIEAYETGELLPYLKKIKKDSVSAEDEKLSTDEKVLLSFLKNERKKAGENKAA